MKRMVSLILTCLLLLNAGAGLAEELHEYWDIPFGVNQNDLRGLIEKQTGVIFDAEDSVRRAIETRTIYLNSVDELAQFGYPLDRLGVVMNDPDGDGSAYYEGLLLLFEEISLGKLPAPGEVDPGTLGPAAERLRALIDAMTKAYGEPTFSQYVLHYSDMSHKQQPIKDLQGVAVAETWAGWFKDWNAFLITINWSNVNLLCSTVKRAKRTYVQAILTFSDEAN